MLLTLLGQTALIALTHAALAVMFIGVGLGVRGTLARPVSTVRDTLIAFWVGLAATVLLLLIWNFFSPINRLTLFAVGAIGLAGIMANLRVLAALPRREPWCTSRGFLLVVGATWLFVANQSRGPITNWDTGLYHWQGVLWAQQHRVVPGLANLFGPLGFNNASLLYDAMLDSAAPGHGGHLANGLLAQMLLLIGVAALGRLRQVGRPERSQAVFEALVLPLAASWSLKEWLTSYVTDVPNSAALFVAGMELHALLLFARDDRSESALDTGYRAITIAALLALAVSFKLSSGAFAGGTFLLALGWIGVERLSGRSLIGAKHLGLAAAGVLAIGATWSVRGIMLSGYPMFPSPSLGLPVAWRTPAEHAAAEFAFAANSAKASTDIPEVVTGVAGVARWFPHWWSLATADIYSILLPALIGAIAGLAWLVLRFRNRREPAPRCWLLLVPALVALLAWFLIAPEPRYATALFWLVAATSYSSLFRIGDAQNSPEAARAVTLAIAILGLSPLLLVPLVKPFNWDAHRSPIIRLVHRDFRYGSDVWPTGWRQTRPPAPYRTRSGLIVMVPASRCWDAPPPCTPNPAPNLRLRVPNRIEEGFWVEGPWQMQNWPGNRPEFTTTWFRAHPQIDSEHDP